MNKADKQLVDAYRADWDPRQYCGDDTYNEIMRDLAKSKVSQTDEEILAELRYIEAQQDELPF